MKKLNQRQAAMKKANDGIEVYVRKTVLVSGVSKKFRKVSK